MSVHREKKKKSYCKDYHRLNSICTSDNDCIFKSQMLSGQTQTSFCNVCFTLSHSLVSFRIQPQAWTSQSAISSLSILINMVHGAWRRKRHMWAGPRNQTILKLSSDSSSDFPLQSLICYVLWGMEESIYTRPRIWINCSLMTGSIWHLKNSIST